MVCRRCSGTGSLHMGYGGRSNMCMCSTVESHAESQVRGRCEPCEADRGLCSSVRQVSWAAWRLQQRLC